MKQSLTVAVVLGAALLAGCPGDESDPTVAFCTGFGNSAAFSWSCTDCQVLNPTDAYDGDLETYASIVPDANVSSETATLNATGAEVAGGAVVGAWVTQPAALTTTDNDFETFLADVSQEVLGDTNGEVFGADEGTPAQGFIGMRTEQAFDEVLFTSTNTFPMGQTPVYRVYEICSDGGAS